MGEKLRAGIEENIQMQTEILDRTIDYLERASRLKGGFSIICVGFLLLIVSLFFSKWLELLLPCSIVIIFFGVFLHIYYSNREVNTKSESSEKFTENLLFGIEAIFENVSGIKTELRRNSVPDYNIKSLENFVRFEDLDNVHSTNLVDLKKLYHKIQDKIKLINHILDSMQKSPKNEQGQVIRTNQVVQDMFKIEDILPELIEYVSTAKELIVDPLTSRIKLYVTPVQKSARALVGDPPWVAAYLKISVHNESEQNIEISKITFEPLDNRVFLTSQSILPSFHCGVNVPAKDMRTLFNSDRVAKDVKFPLTEEGRKIFSGSAGEKIEKKVKCSIILANQKMVTEEIKVLF